MGLWPPTAVLLVTSLWVVKQENALEVVSLPWDISMGSSQFVKVPAVIQVMQLSIIILIEYI